jgi:hypothetical protein
MNDLLTTDLLATVLDAHGGLDPSFFSYQPSAQ